MCDKININFISSFHNCISKTYAEYQTYVFCLQSLLVVNQTILYYNNIFSCVTRDSYSMFSFSSILQGTYEGDNSWCSELMILSSSIGIRLGIV